MNEVVETILKEIKDFGLNYRYEYEQDSNLKNELNEMHIISLNNNLCKMGCNNICDSDCNYCKEVVHNYVHDYKKIFIKIIRFLLELNIEFYESNASFSITNDGNRLILIRDVGIDLSLNDLLKEIEIENAFKIREEIENNIGQATAPEVFEEEESFKL